ncbi:MAG: glutamine cyclotransferase, partial [Candidatus Binataceae bacterium]
MKRSTAEIIREYDTVCNHVHGLTHDGTHVWYATGDTIAALDPDSGETVGALNVPAHAGTAFDGKHLYQIAENVIQKIEPKTGKVIGTIPCPGESNS